MKTTNIKCSYCGRKINPLSICQCRKAKYIEFDRDRKEYIIPGYGEVIRFGKPAAPKYK